MGVVTIEWTKLQTLFDSEEKALKAANVVATTESRLASQPGGPQYDVETRVELEGEGWLVYWRKIFLGYQSGCGGGCNSCSEKPSGSTKGKVIPFKKPR